MLNITEICRSYEEIVDTFECQTILEADDNDYQGDSYKLLKNTAGNYGILIFGWGSCSGCDALQAIVDYISIQIPEQRKEQILRELTELRDQMYSSITWRSRNEMVEYITGKQFDLEWYYYRDGGRKFITMLEDYFNIKK